MTQLKRNIFKDKINITINRLFMHLKILPTYHLSENNNILWWSTDTKWTTINYKYCLLWHPFIHPYFDHYYCSNCQLTYSNYNCRLFEKAQQGHPRNRQIYVYLSIVLFIVFKSWQQYSTLVVHSSHRINKTYYLVEL